MLQRLFSSRYNQLLLSAAMLAVSPQARETVAESRRRVSSSSSSSSSALLPLCGIFIFILNGLFLPASLGATRRQREFKQPIKVRYRQCRLSRCQCCIGVFATHVSSMCMCVCVCFSLYIYNVYRRVQVHNLQQNQRNLATDAATKTSRKEKRKQKKEKTRAT